MLPLTPDKGLAERLRRALPAVLPSFLQGKRWFAGKAATLRSIEVAESIALHPAGIEAFLLLIRIEYASGSVEQYDLPLKVVPLAEMPLSEGPDSSRFLIVLPGDGFPGCVLTDALEDRLFAQFLLEGIERGISVNGEHGDFVAARTGALRELAGDSATSLEPSVMRVEQSNTSINYGDKLILKLFRRVQEGVNLDLETGSFLTEKAHFEHTPSIAGYIEYRRAGRPPVTLAILQGFVPNQGDAWKHALDALDEYFRRTASLATPSQGDWMPSKPLLELAATQTPSFARQVIGAYLSSAGLLGRRTAELHLALSSDPMDPEFTPEPFSLRNRKLLSDETDRLAGHAIRLLQERMEFLTPPVREKARRVLSCEKKIPSRAYQVLALEDAGQCTRIHGDYHLGQVLYTGTDFVIIDFEGEPERSLAERRAKRSPLRDVAGMLRSFHYAASSALLHQTAGGAPAVPAQAQLHLELWAQYWRLWVSVEFLRGYLGAAGKAVFIPPDHEQVRIILDVFLLEKAIYEIIYELKNRPSWMTIPLDGILELL